MSKQSVFKCDWCDNFILIGQNGCKHVTQINLMLAKNFNFLKSGWNIKIISFKYSIAIDWCQEENHKFF